MINEVANVYSDVIFGIMRKLTYLLIALPLFACQPDNSSSTGIQNNNHKNYYELGDDITNKSQAELMNNVQNAMKNGGPVNAISFCNIHASKITDSLSKAFGCEITRLSLKNRSPLNAPKGNEEVLLLNKMLEVSLEGSVIRDTIVAHEGKLLYYKPIFIGMETCLKCHGRPGAEINTETMKVIGELYPSDKATNYRMGDFRGVWKVSFSLD